MKTQIFAYKGIIGATTDLDSGKFINNPKSKSQLGCVISSKEIEITKEAKELLRCAPREGDSFAPIMLTRHTNGTSSIGLIGFHTHLFKGKNLCIGRTCDIEILNDMDDTDIMIPEGFIRTIDDHE